MRKKRHKFKIVLMALLPVLILGTWDICVLIQAHVSSRITISRETTHILEPLNEDGTVNYLAAIDAQCREGITRQNNAAVPIIQALGSDWLPEESRQRIVELLDIELPQAQGAYFVTLNEYEKAHAPVSQPATCEAEQEKSEAERQLKEALRGPWSADDFPIIAGWVEANESQLELIGAASKRTRYYVPLVPISDPPSVMDDLARDLGRLQQVAKALAARAMRKLDSGDLDGAWDDLMATHRLARLISQTPFLIDRLVGVAIEGLACFNDAALAEAKAISSAKALEYLAELQALPPLPGIADTLTRGERFFQLDVTMGVWRAAAEKGGATDLRKLPFGARVELATVNFDDLLRRQNRYLDDLVSMCKEQDFRKRNAALAELYEEAQGLEEEGRRRFKGWSFFATYAKAFTMGVRNLRKARTEAIGDILIGICTPNLSLASALCDRAAMQRDVAEVSLALAAYKADHGVYPETLEALTGNYLQTVPKDLFADGPLRYHRDGQGYLLYSVGINMEDDGGVWDRKAGKDDLAPRHL